MSDDSLFDAFWDAIEPLQQYYEETWDDGRFDLAVETLRRECADRGWDLDAFMSQKGYDFDKIREQYRKGPPAFMRPGWQSPMLGKQIQTLDALLDDITYIRRRPDVLDGKVVVVDFWATWCKYCPASFPHLSDLQTLHGDKIAVIAVCNDGYWDDSGKKPPGTREAVTALLSDNHACCFALDSKHSVRDALYKPCEQQLLPLCMVLKEKTVLYVGPPDNNLDAAVEKALQ